MTAARILVVEDESIVAEDIVQTLQDLGYETAGPWARAEEALVDIDARPVDLALLDIHIAGETDGIALASMLEARGIGVVFLTAFADDATLGAAKLVSPFGYVLKPFDERDLRAALEVALYKQRTEHELHRTQTLLASILDSVQDAVVAIDQKGTISFLNQAASTALGLHDTSAIGQPAWDVVRFADQRAASLTPSIEKAIASGQIRRLARGVTVALPDGEEVTVEGVVAPLRDAQGRPSGATIVFRNMADAARVRALEAEVRELQSALLARARQLV